MAELQIWSMASLAAALLVLGSVFRWSQAVPVRHIAPKLGK